MNAANFAGLPITTLLVNTSNGEVVEPGGLKAWLDKGGCCIGDFTVAPVLAEILENSERGWVGPLGAADTTEMYQRRSDQIVEGLEAFLDGNPVRVVD